ncbi:MAG: hypothetical protein DMG81_04965 [Acidobacteria bacterium]|nr:MAG: hypothetical protein DMG81_04965 [Acidobacteriota bacterium]
MQKLLNGKATSQDVYHRYNAKASALPARTKRSIISFTISWSISSHDPRSGIKKSGIYIATLRGERWV